MRRLVFALCLVSATSLAQQEQDPPPEHAALEEQGSVASERLGWDGFAGEAEHTEDFPTWRDGRKRFFVAGSFDLGFLFVRPRFQFGYGRPHNQWVGVEVNPTVWFDALGGYAGLRFDYPHINFRAGARLLSPNSRTHLRAQESYTRNDLGAEIEGVGTAYLSAEAELTLTLPVGRRGTILSETALTLSLIHI